MADEKKPKAAAQLKAEQRERESLNAQRKSAEREKAAEDQKRQCEAAEKAFAKKILDTWEQAAESAAQRDGVRFVVLAEMALQAPHLPAYMNEVVRTITGAGYELTLESVYQAGALRESMNARTPRTPLSSAFGQRARVEAQTCVDEKGVVGWFEPSAPRIMDAGGGTHHMLLLRWD